MGEQKKSRVDVITEFTRTICTEETVEIMPCPFCGCYDLIDKKDQGCPTGRIYCRRCGAYGPDTFFSNNQKVGSKTASEGWNTRAAGKNGRGQRRIKDRPILLNSEMVRAVLSGQKCQTRRVVKSTLPEGFSTEATIDFIGGYKELVKNKKSIRRVFVDGWYWHDPTIGLWAFSGPIKCPFKVGGRLWVREAWAVSSVYDKIKPLMVDSGAKVSYPATGSVEGLKLRPSIFMPRWSSRIILEIDRVRVECVQDITQQDCEKEGFTGMAHESLRDVFKRRWDKIYGPRGFGWSANPFVWVVDFHVVVK